MTTTDLVPSSERSHALVAPAEARREAPAEPQPQRQEPQQREVPPPPPRRFYAMVLAGVLLLLVWGIYQHWQQAAAAAETQQQTRNYIPEIRVAVAQRDDKPLKLTLPGQTAAFDLANIYARATGYIAERRVDIGSRVKQGDLLVRIAAPDLDQELLQAEAQLGQYHAQVLEAQAQVLQAEANTRLANVTKYRETTLAAQGWETKQNADNSTANFSVQRANVVSAMAAVALAEANLRAQMATVQRLQALTAFERVTAPFDGVVTVRNVDTGDLVSADNAGGAPMFTLARDDVLRVQVNVPQSGAIGVHDGDAAQVEVPELPGRIFEGRVARSSVALSDTSRTLLTEVDVPNPTGELRPGLYADITIDIPRQYPGIIIPDEALVFNENGMQVAVLQKDGTIRYQNVSVYRDFGTTAELRQGLQGGEKIALDLPAGLPNGAKVKVAPSSPQGQSKPGASSPQQRAS